MTSNECDHAGKIDHDTLQKLAKMMRPLIRNQRMVERIAPVYFEGCIKGAFDIEAAEYITHVERKTADFFDFAVYSTVDDRYKLGGVMDDGGIIWPVARMEDGGRWRVVRAFIVGGRRYDGSLIANAYKELNK